MTAPCPLLKVFSLQEIQTARRTAVITEIATEVTDSWLFPKAMSCKAAAPLPPMALSGELVVLFILSYDLKVTDVVICISAPSVFGQKCMVWDYPSSVIIRLCLNWNKATWIGTTRFPHYLFHFFFLFVHDASSGMREKKLFQKEDCRCDSLAYILNQSVKANSPVR